MNQPAKRVLITGAASGIGAATAALFARRGWSVGLADIDAEGLEKAASALGGGGSTHRLDVGERAAWDAAVADFAAANGGRLDLLVNNAGTVTFGALATMDEGDIRRMVDTNLMGVIHGARAAHGLLAATPGSAIVNVASFLALSGAGQGAVYSATKAAVRALTEAMAMEYRYDGIAVSDVLPAFVATAFFEGAPEREARGQVLADAGVRFIPPEQVAAAIWDAAHKYRLHRLVGRQARIVGLLQRIAPGMVHTHLRKVSKRLREAAGG